MYLFFIFLKLYIFFIILFQCSCKHKHKHKHNKKDLFVKAYELLDLGEYDKSFNILKVCVHYDIRCLTFIGEFYYLGLKPVKRDVLNALYIWKVASDYGSSDAQFYLGIMYSNYFSLPNIYSYYVENRIGNNLIIRLNELLNTKYLKCDFFVKKKIKNFRNIPIIKFNKDNELILKIKNIQYNLDELKNYFENLNFFKNQNNFNYTKNHNLSLLYFYSSSLAYHPGSILALGNKYMNGYGVEKDCDTAFGYYLKLSNYILNFDEKKEFEIIDLIKLNIPHYDKYNLINKKIKNIELLLETSLHNNHRLLTMIARRYLIGIDGVEKNYKKAFEYLNRAANFKNSEALSLLGYIYLLGLGRQKDYNKASEYFIEGKKLSDPLSYNGLGYMHFFGLGNFKKNTYLAFHYFELAAKNNLSSAQFNLGCLYLSGMGETQSFQNAFYWLYKSLNNGNILAAYLIGFLHYNGIIVSRNCKFALSLLSKVTETNNFILNTTHRIIKYNEKGRYKEAIFLMALLAETGHLQSQVNLSYKLYNKDFSLFLPEDKKSSKIYSSKYLVMASEHNDFKSLYTLGDYAYNGLGVYVTIIPKNNLAINSTYDFNDNSHLYIKKKEEKENIKNNLNNNNIHEFNAHNHDKIISTDFIDEEGNVFNDKWRFNYSIKFTFNNVDYKLAYHHYKNIISFYPTNISIIKTISKACYNLGYMHYYGIGVSKNIKKALLYFNSSIKIYPEYKLPSVLFVSYIKINKYLHNLKRKICKKLFFL